VYIEKADGRQRPLGVAAMEDKVVQHAVVKFRPLSQSEKRASGLHESEFTSLNPKTPEPEDAAVAQSWNLAQPGVDQQVKRLSWAWGLSP
jgi:hypothetical protein